MQTFLPYPNFFRSAYVLDKQRCWKQVVEARQIIDCLEGTRCARWGNHPAVKMWEGHILALKHYFNTFLKVCKEKHMVNTKYEYYLELEDLTLETVPWWFGDADFHRAMRARLIEKDRAFYLKEFSDDEGFNDGKYFWPVMDGSETFRVI